VKNGKSGFNFRKEVFRTPPEVVSSFGGGGGVCWNGVLTCGWGVVFENHHSGPPPLVKIRMVRGGPEFLRTVRFNMICFLCVIWCNRCMGG
jgi:hypothetical protein